jgi:predicted glycosyltransferase
MEIAKGKTRALICPLGWGMGHATRMIPIINFLKSQGVEVVVAGDERVRPIFQNRFIGTPFILFPSYRVELSAGENQLFSLIGITFRMLWATCRETRHLRTIVESHKIDLIISDNRYGLYSKKVDSILVTHQLNIIFPAPFKWLAFIGQWYVRQYAHKHTECWIPDNEAGTRLSGVLSSTKKMPRNTKFIGLLSRFSNAPEILPKANAWELVVIASGPSPQREFFVQGAIDLANRLEIKTLILRGNPQESEQRYIGSKILLVPTLNDEEMRMAVLSADYLICRAGYSTIMDLIALGRKALLIPTPGQTEQEYLAQHLSAMGMFATIAQGAMKNLSLESLKSLKEPVKYGLNFFQPEQ